jgi:hypothetical protein
MKFDTSFLLKGTLVETFKKIASAVLKNARFKDKQALYGC